MNVQIVEGLGLKLVRNAVLFDQVGMGRGAKHWKIDGLLAESLLVHCSLIFKVMDTDIWCHAPKSRN